MDLNYDYSAAFKAISVKLKKRFLRKPNVSDAIEEYTALSRQLESEECFGLAGYCMQQVAKSYHSVGNTVSESASLQSAAKQYLNAEITSTVESGILTFNEDLLSAISLYEEAIRLHCEQNERHLAAKLCSGLADIMAQKFERHFEALPYYERAIALCSDQTNSSSSPLLVLVFQFKLAALKVFTCDYSGALNLYTEICSSIINKTKQQTTATTTNVNSTSSKQQNRPSSMPKTSSFGENSSQQNSVSTSFTKPIGYNARLLVDADICKLLLLLYLNPTKMKPEHASTLEVYSWFQTLSDTSSSAQAYVPITCMSRDLFILLQSFVMACKSSDTRILFTLQTELWTHLSDVQNFMVNQITDQITHSSYTDDLLAG